MITILVVATLCLLGLVILAVGMRLVLWHSLPGIRNKQISRSDHSAAIRKGVILAIGGIVVALTTFAWGFFVAIPGPGFREAWKQTKAYVSTRNPDDHVTSVSITWPTSSTEPISYYDVAADTTRGPLKLRMYFDPVTKKVQRIEEKP